MHSDLLSFLNTQIPLTRSLGLTIISIDETGARIRAPLGPNHNHMGSAFGGSLATMMILSGYIWLYDALLRHGHRAHVILFKEESEYLRPVVSDIEVLALAPSGADWKRCEDGLLRKGTGRITLHAEIQLPEGLAARFTGEFVAKRS